ncbi:uncharacterized protein SCHCODRAFT_02495727 [Schizophyllum commune H4-8]|nr:uncharacterized protein SCHCODRAFT_02495727 [Schizophyllum commune H4-8]KAI5895045.1 hypothetical protein SCHCODRAFT_02495727 [Schizophyllum commune H4-8]
MSAHTTPFASSSRSSSQRTDVLSNDDEDIFDTSIDISYSHDEGYSFDASSPISSPGGPVDSSPPSSPGLMGNALDDQDEEMPKAPAPAASTSSRISDLYAATGPNDKWKPPSREKGAPKRPHGDSESVLEPKRQKLSMPPPPPTSRPSRPVRSTVLKPDPLQDAVDAAFEATNLVIDVSEKGLTELRPDPLQQLKKMVVIPQDQETVHARSASSRTFSKSTSFSRVPSASLAGTPSHTIRFMASKNAITKLPRELFDLTRLTTLDLRHNRITHVPAGIGLLINLDNLCLSNNPIRYLPAEILHLHKLKHLLLFPNSRMRVKSSPHRTVDETHCFGESSVPQLTELMLRKLLAPHHTTSTGECQTYMEAKFTLPITHYFSPVRPCPPHILRVLADCLPRSVPVGRQSSSTEQHGLLTLPVRAHGPASIFMSDFTTEEDAREDPNEVRAIDADEQYEVLRCPNPAHGRSRTSSQGSSQAHDERGPVFIHPLEVRFTWETQFGLAIPGGAIPVRWRGCSWGCLDFLGGEEADGEEKGFLHADDDDEEEIHAVTGLGTGVGTFSDDEDA